MNTNFKTYSVCGVSNDHDIKHTFITQFWSLLLEALNKDKEFCPIKFLRSRYKTNSEGCVISSIRARLVFHFSKVRDKRTQQVVLKVDINKLRDGLINGLDNNVIGEVRRNPNKEEEQLLIFQQLLNETGDFGFSFFYEPEFMRISHLSSVDGRRRGGGILLGNQWRIFSQFTDATEGVMGEVEYETEIKR